jgi:hypothetical protein
LPPLPSVPATLRITTHFQIGADAAALIRHFVAYTGGAPSNSDCLAFATAIYAGGVAHLCPILCDNNYLTGVAVQDLASPTGGFGEYLSSTVGSRGTANLGASTAFLLSSNIARRYRGGKPRTYFPVGVSGDLVSPTEWDAVPYTQLEAGCINYMESYAPLTEGTTTTGARVSVSYYAGFTAVTNPITGRTKDVAKLRPGGPVVDLITGGQFSLKPASQRRRNTQKR